MEQKHSGIGIASFSTSIACLGIFVLMLVIAVVAGTSTPGGLVEVMGLFVIVLLFADFVALGLGIAGLCQND